MPLVCGIANVARKVESSVLLIILWKQKWNLRKNLELLSEQMDFFDLPTTSLIYAKLTVLGKFWNNIIFSDAHRKQ